MTGTVHATTWNVTVGPHLVFAPSGWRVVLDNGDGVIEEPLQAFAWCEAVKRYCRPFGGPPPPHTDPIEAFSGWEPVEWNEEYGCWCGLREYPGYVGVLPPRVPLEKLAIMIGERSAALEVGLTRHSGADDE